ncbi:unannotated protein [freshwater metagenome]|uniref:Unannotated protein n=1 Tax=freshwater metagenome TaxID=449393 RepID=A0A6J5Z089_9ZZZZ
MKLWADITVHAHVGANPLLTPPHVSVESRLNEAL